MSFIPLRSAYVGLTARRYRFVPTPATNRVLRLRDGAVGRLRRLARPVPGAAPILRTALVASMLAVGFGAGWLMAIAGL